MDVLEAAVEEKKNAASCGASHCIVHDVQKDAFPVGAIAIATYWALFPLLRRDSQLRFTRLGG